MNTKQKLQVIKNLYTNSAALKFGARLLLLADATADLGLKLWIDATGVEIKRKNGRAVLLRLASLG